ncbi:MAG TPA: glycosyltransferase family 39 protein, partial [Pseudolabrys sp.]|nr:glycosyltransferase family 39 protein [Pseudolabrys sp.]
MGLVPLMDTTEARYGEIARKMAELNDWVTPWFDYGVPYWGKPPLAFWLTATSFKVFG